MGAENPAGGSGMTVSVLTFALAPRFAGPHGRSRAGGNPNA
jgi:hypothetical protein